MKEGPNISMLGAVIGDPARANMLSALMSGKALTASELASEAGVTVQTASSHLSKLESAGLITRRKQGRHRYFTLADDEVSHLLEVMMGYAAKRGHMRTRTGPKDPTLRKARICYNHLAGEMGVQLYDSLVARKYLDEGDGITVLTDAGREFVDGIGIDLAALEKERRPLCRSCLDWSARRSHLAGALGVAFLAHVYGRDWAKKSQNSRAIIFSPQGEAEFRALFPK